MAAGSTSHDRDRCRDRSCRRSIESQLSRQDRPAFFKPDARRHVWNGEFANGTRQAILIPRSAVVLRGSLSCAYVLDGQGIAQLRYLTLGAHARRSRGSALGRFPPAKSLSTHPPTAIWPASASRFARGPAMNQELGIAGRLAHSISQLQADAALHCRVAGHRNLRRRDHSPRRRAADPCSHAGHHHRHAGRIAGRGGRARHAADREPGASDLGRRICVLDVGAGAEPGDRALSGRHAAGRCADQGL